MEAYSFNQLLSMVCSISGQALGVWLLAISHQNFALVASINALTFSPVFYLSPDEKKSS